MEFDSRPKWANSRSKDANVDDLRGSRRRMTPKLHFLKSLPGKFGDRLKVQREFDMPGNKDLIKAGYVWVIKIEFKSCCRGKGGAIFESGSEINGGSLQVLGCLGQSHILREVSRFQRRPRQSRRFRALIPIMKTAHSRFTDEMAGTR